MHRKTGFTLVEVLFVLVIVAAVMAYAVPSYKRTRDRAKYDAATGILVDVGSSIQALKRDLAMQNYVIDFPLDTATAAKEITGLKETEDTEKTLLEYMNDQTGSANRDAAFVKSLYTFGYLEPFSRTDAGYNYYAIRGNASTVCNQKCRDSAGVIACMCKSALVNADCYYGAAFLSTGIVKRLEGSTCRS